MTSSSGRWIAALIIVAALVVSTLQFGLPAWSQYKEQKSQLAAAEKQLQAAEQTQQQKLQNKQPLTSDQQDVIAAALPESFDPVKTEDVLTRTIEGAGTQVLGIEFDVAPADAAALSPADPQAEWPESRLVSVEISGKYAQVVASLRALEGLMSVDPSSGVVTKGPVQGAMVLPVEGVNLTHTPRGLVTGSIYVRAFGG